jgi:hypothetical protein
MRDISMPDISMPDISMPDISERSMDATSSCAAIMAAHAAALVAGWTRTSIASETCSQRFLIASILLQNENNSCTLR